MEENNIAYIMELCERLKQEMDATAEIPESCLAGQIREALLEIRELQRKELNEIRRKIL